MAEDLTGSLHANPRILAEVRRLSKISEFRGLRAIARQWLVILLAFSAWFSLSPELGAWRWALYAVCVLIIATRQHALAILMHEAAHGRLSTRKAVSDFFSDVFCAFPLGLSTELYRRRHLRHHQHTNTDQDPDWALQQQYEEWNWPKEQIDAALIFIQDLLGLAAPQVAYAVSLWSPVRRIFFKYKVKLTPAERIRQLTFTTSFVVVVTVFHLWLAFFLLWLVPAFTVLAAITRLRAVAEHMVVESEHEMNKTRHVEGNWIEHLILAPLNVNYHLTHHLYPSVPYYHLPEMHQILMQEESFRKHAHLTSSYWGIRQSVWAEVTRPLVNSA